MTLAENLAVTRLTQSCLLSSTMIMVQTGSRGCKKEKKQVHWDKLVNTLMGPGIAMYVYTKQTLCNESPKIIDKRT